MIRFIGFIFLLLASASASDLRSGLRLWWSFNDPGTRGVYDSSGLSNHGRIGGEVLREPGRVGTCLRFGFGRSASGNFSEALIKAGAEEGAYTISAWVRPDGDQGGRERLIVGKPGFHAGLMAHSERGENVFGFTLWDKNGKSTQVLSPPISDFSAWHHLTLVYDARRITLFIDGRAVKSGRFEGELRDYPNQIFVGGLSRGNFDFKGLVDEVRIHNRALSEKEVSEAMANEELAETRYVPGEEPAPIVKLEKDRPELSKPLFTGKPVIAHYMTQMTTFGSDKNYFMNPAYGLPDGPASNVGGAVHYDSFFAHSLAGKSPEEVIEAEVRMAKKLGIDGFHFYYQAPEPGPNPGAGNNAVIRQFFKVLRDKNIDFKLTLCISHPNQAVAAGEKIKATAQAIRPLLDEFGDSPNWLRAPDGRYIFFTWSTEGFSEGVRSHGELFRKPDLEAQVKALAEGYESLRQLLRVPAAFVFHAWDLDSMYIATKDLANFDLARQYETYIDAVVGYFPAVTGFADYPANETTTAEWKKWAEACAKRGRAYGQAVMTDYVKTYKKNGKLPGAADFPDLKINQTKSLYLALPGAVPYRTLWRRAVDFDASFVSYVTWNDYPEGHHLAPEVHHPYAFALLSDHYIKEWRGIKGTPTNDVAMVFYHKYPVEAKPLIFPMKAEVVPWHIGRERVDLKTLDFIDAVVILQAPGEVWMNGKKVLAAGAGLSSVQVPMKAGPIFLEIRRGAKVVKSLRPPEWITDRPYRTDRLIVGYSTECDAFVKENFPGLVLPGTDEYAEDGSGVPNWKKRYKIPSASVDVAQEKILPLEKVAEDIPAELKPILVSETKASVQELPLEKPKEPWKGPEDLSGKFFLANDASSLFVRIEVRDDKHVDPPADPSQMWKADSVQIGVATFEGKNNFECGIALRGSETLFHLWQTPVKDAAQRVTYSASSEGGKIVYKLKVPLELFGLKAGDLVGVSAVVNDADVKERNNFLEFGTGIGLSKEPDSYGHYRLAK